MTGFFSFFSVFLLITSALLSGCAARAQGEGSWKNVRISGSGCWVTGIVAQPRVPGLFYVRTDVGGCYRWNSAARAWIPITDFLPFQQRGQYGCESLAVDPNEPNTLYIACGSSLPGQYNAQPGTLYKSRDRGATWTALGLTGVYLGGNDSQRWGGERLAVQPAAARPGRLPVMLFGSRTQGLWRSTDGGAHWQQSSLPYPQGKDIVGVQAVAFDPRAPRTVYVAVSQNGIFRSTDSGSTWTNVSTAITKPGRLIVDQTGTVWVTYGNGVSKFSQGKWTDCTPSGAAAEAYSGLAVNPRDPKNVLVSYGLWGDPQPDAIFETKDGGASWDTLAANLTTDVPWYKAANPNGIKPFDISNFLFDPNKPGSVWLVSGGGIWNTPDIARQGGPTFFHQESGHEELCVTALAAPARGPELLVGVADVNGFAFDKGVDAYPSRTFVDTDSWASATAAIAYEERDPRNMVRLCVQGTLWDKPCLVATSSDGGSTWARDASFPTIALSGDGKPLVPRAVAMSAADPANVLVNVVDAGSGSSVWLTKKSGTTSWTPCAGLPAGAAAGEGTPAAADPVVGGTFYVYSGGMVYRSTDGGATFRQMSAGPVGAAGPASFFKLAAQPGLTGDLWLSEENDNPNYFSNTRVPWEGLYHSRDAGRTWTKLPNVSRAVTFSFGAPAPDGRSTLFYFGRQAGSSADSVFRSGDLGATWTDLRSPGEALGDSPWFMEGSRQTFGRLFVGTGGRGVYYSTAAGNRR